MAQPLYIAGITTTLGTCSGCNMLVAVTLNGTVFAWVADGTGAGNLLWSRQGTPSSGPGNAGNALWYDDCGTSGTPAQRSQTMQFQGIVSTPVIDASGSTPVMFLASYCTNTSNNPAWWFHEINLQNGHDVAATNIGSDVRGLGCSGCSGFTDAWEQQRAALLEVKNSNNSSTPNLIYILFGTGVQENVYSKPYAGWLVAYTVGSGGPSPVFAYSNQPTSCGTGGGLTNSLASNGQCSGNSGSPSCDCYVNLTCPVTGDTCNNSTGYCTVSTGTACINLGAPNWGGHGGGCWMSGNGAAATALDAINSDHSVHVFFGCGNGGFQEFNGSTPDASNNNGETVMDFRLTSSSYSTSPFQTFTPNSPASGVAPPLPAVCGCNSSGGGCQPCTLTFQALNAGDFDMAVSGVTLLNDLAGAPRLVTIDKAGYGYLMTQGNLCGVGSTDTNCIGFASGDPGSLMTFGASQILCNAYPDNCDRVATMALFDNRGTGSGRAVYLNYWPNNERLTSLRMSDDATWINAAGTQELTWTSGTSQTLNLNGTCTANTNCLPDQIVAGDSLQLSPCGCGTSGCPVVTTVAATSLTINMTVATAFSSSCTAPQSFEYEGYFVKPAHDHTPTVSSGGYPGAAVTVTANCTSPPCTNALVWAVLPGSDSQADTLMRGLGTVYAYTALPNSYDLLANDWSSTDTWCASSFARPTIVNAGAFVPTYAVSTGGRSFPGGTCPTTSTSGIPYPSGILVYH
jgi:hypothetical protein